MFSGFSRRGILPGRRVSGAGRRCWGCRVDGGAAHARTNAPDPVSRVWPRPQPPSPLPLCMCRGGGVADGFSPPPACAPAQCQCPCCILRGRRVLNQRLRLGGGFGSVGVVHGVQSALCCRPTSPRWTAAAMLLLLPLYLVAHMLAQRRWSASGIVRGLLFGQRGLGDSGALVWR